MGRQPESRQRRLELGEGAVTVEIAVDPGRSRGIDQIPLRWVQGAEFPENVPLRPEEILLMIALRPAKLVGVE